MGTPSISRARPSFPQRDRSRRRPSVCGPGVLCVPLSWALSIRAWLFPDAKHPNRFVCRRAIRSCVPFEGEHPAVGSGPAGGRKRAPCDKSCETRFGYHPLKERSKERSTRSSRGGPLPQMGNPTGVGMSRQDACRMIQATYLSIQVCKKALLPAPMPPASSNSPSFIWMNASGWPRVGTSR